MTPIPKNLNSMLRARQLAVDAMGARGKAIHALEPKIRIMAEVMKELGRIEELSIPEFAHSASIDYNALKAMWSADKLRLSSKMEAKLAKTAGFDVSDPAWVDHSVSATVRAQGDGPRYPGSDTAAAFRARLREIHNLPGADVRVRVEDGRPQLLDQNLASFSVTDSGQASLLGEPAPMFFSLVMEPGFLPNGLAYGFRRVRLRLAFAGESNTQVISAHDPLAAIEIKDAIVEFRGDKHHPEWFIHVERSVLKGQYVTTSDPFCSLNNLKLGEEFGADISVQSLDGSLIALDGTNLPPTNKQRILEILAAKKLRGTVNSHGWISLGVQRLRLIRAERS